MVTTFPPAVEPEDGDTPVTSGSPDTKLTSRGLGVVFVTVIESVVSLAVRSTLWAVVSVTVKLATPSAFVVASMAEMVALVEDPWVRETVLPGTPFPYWSSRVTVTVTAPVPSADWVVGVATALEVVVETGPAVTVSFWVPEVSPDTDAVITGLPARVSA
jgi:hypothetical protein